MTNNETPSESAKEMRMAYDGKWDWVEALMAEVPAVEPNPHYHCDTQSTEPCPTGEHRNPFPV